MTSPPTASTGGGTAGGAEARNAGSVGVVTGAGTASAPGASAPAGGAPGAISVFSAALATLRSGPAALTAPGSALSDSQANAATANAVAVKPGVAAVDDGSTQAAGPDPDAATAVTTAVAGRPAPPVLALIGTASAPLALTSPLAPREVDGPGPTKAANAKRSSPGHGAAAGAAAGGSAPLVALVMGMSVAPSTAPTALEPAAARGSSSQAAVSAAHAAVAAGAASATLAQAGSTAGAYADAAAALLAGSGSAADASATDLPQDSAHGLADSSPGASNPAGAGAALASALRVVGGANTPAVRTIPLAVHDRQWPLALATQVMTIVTQKLTTATLRLTPAHLGPVDVRIDMRDSQINVNFGAAQPATRSALEQALPQLRAMMAGAGLTLGEASVQQHSGHSAPPAPRPWSDGAAPEPELDLSAAPRAAGLIDEYV